MKIKLPQETVELDLRLKIEDRIIEVEKILSKEIVFHSESMSVEEYFNRTWNNSSTKICLDIIGYYLTKIEKDLSTLSNDKMKEMSRGSKRHTTFSGMGYENQLAVGLVDIDDSNYN